VSIAASTCASGTPASNSRAAGPLHGGLDHERGDGRVLDPRPALRAQLEQQLLDGDLEPVLDRLDRAAHLDVLEEALPQDALQAGPQAPGLEHRLDQAAHGLTHICVGPATRVEADHDLVRHLRHGLAQDLEQDRALVREVPVHAADRDVRAARDLGGGGLVVAALLEGVGGGLEHALARAAAARLARRPGLAPGGFAGVGARAGHAGLASSKVEFDVSFPLMPELLNTSVFSADG
jgi:hypothetical protein